MPSKMVVNICLFHLNDLFCTICFKYTTVKRFYHNSDNEVPLVVVDSVKDSFVVVDDVVTGSISERKLSMVKMYENVL